MADPSMPSFQVPPEMRTFAEQSFEQARKAFDSLFATVQRSISNLEGQVAAAQTGAKDIQQKAVGYTERNIAASFDLAQRLLQATTPEELVRLHADHVKSQIETLTGQARELGRTASVAMNQAKPKN